MRMSTWRFLGTYKQGYIGTANKVITIVTLLITLLLSTHESPSRSRILKEQSAI